MIVGYLLYNRYFVSVDFILRHCLLLNACCVILLYSQSNATSMVDIWMWRTVDDRKFFVPLLYWICHSSQMWNFRCNFTFCDCVVLPCVEMGMFKNNASRFLYVLLLFNFFIVMWLCSFSNLLRFKFISSYTPAYLCDATRICIVIFVIWLYSEFY